MVCGMSLSHSHSQLHTLLSLKWGGQCLLPSSCLTCICQIYIVFPWHSIKNVSFQLFSPPPTPCFYLPWRESCTIWWKKIPLMEREGGVPLLRSQSADLLYSREKKNEPTLLEADVDTVSVIEDGKSWLSRCSYKGVLTAVRDPVMDHLLICGRTAEASRKQIWSHSVILTWKRHQRLSLFGVFFFLNLPFGMNNGLFQTM